MIRSMCVLPRVDSKLNTRVVTKSSHFGESRTDREMYIFTHSHNCTLDVARGMCRRDLFGVRHWVEEDVARLWTEIEGTPPGGNLMMPAQRPSSSPYSEVHVVFLFVTPPYAQPEWPINALHVARR